ncbi:MAG: enoyl-CoA hydratase-related protein [Bacteroidota bacterium]
MNTILFDKQAGIATITLNRPKAYNSVTRELAFAFQTTLDECANDETIRVVVITGAGKAFCAGQDLVEVTTPEQMPGFQTILQEHFNPIINKIVQLEKPVLAAVNGVAAGAGASIALACDIIVAAETASFIQAFSKIGLIPDGGSTYTLPRIVGFQKALALAMLGDKVSAAEAEKMGMIYKFFQKEQFDDEVQNLAKRLAQMPTKGLSYIKKAFHQSLNNTLAAQLEVETNYQLLASETADYQEGVQAFLEKRKAVFIGR